MSPSSRWRQSIPQHRHLLTLLYNKNPPLGLLLNSVVQLIKSLSVSVKNISCVIGIQ
jgi:hypothetical protein